LDNFKLRGFHPLRKELFCCNWAFRFPAPRAIVGVTDGFIIAPIPGVIAGRKLYAIKGFGFYATLSVEGLILELGATPEEKPVNRDC
jgi:hypothetical protein